MMKSADEIGITFVNRVLGQGFMNGVVNITLGSFQFTPNDDGKTIDPDLIVASRLRMDEQCATQLRDALATVLASMADARMKSVVEATAANGDSNAQEKEMMN